MASPSPKRVDIFLQRLAWSSQVVLVVAGIFGYFFTVRPVHQKQLLDEQIAERTISLKAATSTLQEAKLEADRLHAENSNLGAEANKLRTEAVQTYGQLRTNVSLELLSIPSECAVKLKQPPSSPTDVPSCVLQFAVRKISRSLKVEDQTLLKLIVARHSGEMIHASAEADKKFAGRSRQIERDLKQVRAELESSTADIRAEILRLRIARANGRVVDPDSPTGRIIIRAEEDQQAFDNYVGRRAKLYVRLNNLNLDKAFFDVDFENAYREALSPIASKMLEEFRRGAKGS